MTDSKIVSLAEARKRRVTAFYDSSTWEARSDMIEDMVRFLERETVVLADRPLPIKTLAVRLVDGIANGAVRYLGWNEDDFA